MSNQKILAFSFCVSCEATERAAALCLPAGTKIGEREAKKPSPETDREDELGKFLDAFFFLRKNIVFSEVQVLGVVHQLTESYHDFYVLLLFSKWKFFLYIFMWNIVHLHRTIHVQLVKLRFFPCPKAALGPWCRGYRIPEDVGASLAKTLWS